MAIVSADSRHPADTTVAPVLDVAVAGWPLACAVETCCVTAADGILVVSVNDTVRYIVDGSVEVSVERRADDAAIDVTAADRPPAGPYRCRVTLDDVVIVESQGRAMLGLDRTVRRLPSGCHVRVGPP